MEKVLKVIALSLLMTGFYGFVSGMDAEEEASSHLAEAPGETLWAGETNAKKERHSYSQLHEYLGSITDGADWINTTAAESGKIVCLYYSVRNRSDALDGKCVLGKDQSFQIVFSVLQYLTRVALDSLLIDVILGNPVKTQPDAYLFLKDKVANHFLTEKRRAHIHPGVKLDDVFTAVSRWFEEKLNLKNLHNPIWTLTVGWNPSWLSALNPCSRAISYGQDDPALIKTYRHNLLKCFGSKQHPLELRKAIVDRYISLFEGKTLDQFFATNLSPKIREDWKDQIYGDLNCDAEESDIEFEENKEELARNFQYLSIKKPLAHMKQILLSDLPKAEADLPKMQLQYPQEGVAEEEVSDEDLTDQVTT